MIVVLKKLRFLDNLEAHSFSDSILDFIKSMIIFYYHAHIESWNCVLTQTQSSHLSYDL